MIKHCPQSLRSLHQFHVLPEDLASWTGALLELITQNKSRPDFGSMLENGESKDGVEATPHLASAYRELN